MPVAVARVGDIVPGGMKRVKVEGQELVLCNCDGVYYAVSRRCGHMNASLEMGTLDGAIVTCPLHHVQFDVTTGEALNYPISEYSDAPLPEAVLRRMKHQAMLMYHIRVCDIKTREVTIEGDAIFVGDEVARIART